MDCAAFKETAALFALGGLDASERAACEEHLKQPAHDGCVEALAEAMAAVASIEREAEAPAPRVWSGIASRIAPAAERLRRARRRASVAIAVALACAAALVILFLRGSALQHQVEEARARNVEREQVATSAVRDRDLCLTRVQRLELRSGRTIEDEEKMRREAVSLLELPGTQLFPLAAEKGQKATANAIMHTGLKRAYVVADGLAPVRNHDYQMWIAKGKKVVPAGLVHSDEHGRAVIRIDYASLLGEVGAPDAMMITLEPQGGGPVVRGPTILLGAPHS
jgi:anti-sigma-K factor RskA